MYSRSSLPRRRLAGAVPLAAVALVAVPTLAACTTGPVTERHNNYDVSGTVTRLVLTGTEGDVRVSTGDGPVRVAETIAFTADEPTTSHRVDGSTLYVEVKDLSGDLRITTTAGGIEASGLHGQHVDARTEAGEVTLAHQVAPVRTSARSEAGAVTVRLPGTGTYAVEVITDAGKRDVGVSVDPGSAHRVTAWTEAGNVTVSPA